MPTLKAIHSAKSLKKAAAQAKTYQRNAFPNAPNRTENKVRKHNNVSYRSLGNIRLK